MLPKSLKAILALIATCLVSVFVFGLAHSISSGFAGFWGGLPFWVISVFVMSLAFYDFYDECIRKKDSDH